MSRLIIFFMGMMKSYSQVGTSRLVCFVAAMSLIIGALTNSTPLMVGPSYKYSHSGSTFATQLASLSIPARTILLESLQ